MLRKAKRTWRFMHALRQWIFNLTVDVQTSKTTCSVTKYATAQVIQQWVKSGTGTGQRWLEIFQHFRIQQIECDAILPIVQSALAVPGTNAPIERIFSLMNDMWSDCKTQLVVETLKSMLITRVNVDKPCPDFYELIRQNKKLLNSIHSVQKYTSGDKKARNSVSQLQRQMLAQ